MTKGQFIDSSSAYLKYDPDGTFHELRLYDENHALYLEIAYHVETTLGQGKILHFHIYDERFSKTNGTFFRSEAIRVTEDMDIYIKYKKVFRGVKL